MAEEYREDNPGNPRLMDTFRDYTERLKKFVTGTIWPPGTKFECRGCGDCCTWHYYKFPIDKALKDHLLSMMPEPHGFWLLLDDHLRIELPVWNQAKNGEIPKFFVKGTIPENHLTFHKVTGRRHGYWVLYESTIIVYSPVSCIHLNEEGLCDIYEERPRVCRQYLCGKYPVIP